MIKLEKRFFYWLLISWFTLMMVGVSRIYTDFTSEPKGACPYQARLINQQNQTLNCVMSNGQKFTITWTGK